MSCYHPLEAWKKPGSGVTFKPQDSIGIRVQLPCGQCIGCRIDYARSWAARIVHESRFHETNCFITLTYDPEHLPESYSINKRHLQLFFKKLRKKLPNKIRYYAVGEYGDKSLRPHYHAIIFGEDFYNDRKLFSRGHGYPLYCSALLDETWGMGHCTIGDLNVQTAYYTARYSTKKIKGKQASEHYKRVHPVTGEIFDVEPEFSLSSGGGKNNGGIGTKHFQKYQDSIIAHDDVILDGYRTRTPRFYDKLIDKVNPETLRKVKEKRLARALEHRDNNTVERLAVREQVTKAKQKFRSSTL